jgi:hypothetical protein
MIKRASGCRDIPIFCPDLMPYAGSNRDRGYWIDDADLYGVSFHAVFFSLIVERALNGPSQIFTLEIDGRPTLVFEATEFAEATRICLDADLRSDLRALTSDGIPICTESAMLNPRPAVEEEVTAFERAVKLAPASDEPTMAFLVKIDGVIVVAVDPH